MLFINKILILKLKGSGHNNFIAFRYSIGNNYNLICSFDFHTIRLVCYRKLACNCVDKMKYNDQDIIKSLIWLCDEFQIEIIMSM